MGIEFCVCSVLLGSCLLSYPQALLKCSIVDIFILIILDIILN